MIQRIQTIFLLLSGAAFGALMALPFATSGQQANQMFADGRFSVTDNIALETLALLGAALAIICIFLFRRRRLQIRFGYVLMVISVAIAAIAYFSYARQAAAMSGQVHAGAGVFLPVGALIFAVLANYYIRKDERIVKSMDRLR